MKKVIKLSTLTLIIFFLNTQTSISQCHINDWTALKALYDSTNGDNWTNRIGWDFIIDSQNSPPAGCDLNILHGVSIGPNGRVECIDFEGSPNCLSQGYGGNNLTGSLPSEISNLSQLKQLILTNNMISGDLPLELFNLTNLIVLEIDGNQLTGEIPTQIDNLINLIELNLSLNTLTGGIPAEIVNLTNLVTLNLSGNNLSNIMPLQIGNLSNLEILFLSYNQLQGSIPSSIGNLSNLKYCNLESNSLSGSIPSSLGNLSNLEELRLSRNIFTSNIPPQLGNCSNLKVLNLWINSFSGTIPGELGNLSNLECLNIGNNQLSGNLPPELCNLDNLVKIVVNNNNLSGAYPSCYINFCPQLSSPHFYCNASISDSNNFNETWEEFCDGNGGKCDGDPCGCMDSTACNFDVTATCNATCNYGDSSCVDPCNCSSIDVWPGDLNFDGICNNQDFAYSYLFIGESGIPRNPGGIGWQAQSCEAWGIPQANGSDIKHHDCDGNGNINTNDANAIIVNYNKTHPLPAGINLQPLQQFPVTNYQIHLQPINQISPNDPTIVMNVVMDSKLNNELNVFAGFFSIDISSIAVNIDTAFISFENVSWLGIPNLNLLANSWYNANENTIEVGFTKTDSAISTGKGVIAKLVIVLNSTNLNRVNSCENLIDIEINEIGSFDNNENHLPIENDYLTINLGTSCCAPSLNITEATPFQNLYQSSGTITTSDYLPIGENQKIEYNASRVTLNAGFSVRAGADFKVRSSGCN